MMPRLIAEESIAAANRIALGSNTMRRADAVALQRRWTKAAQGPSARPATPQSIWGPLAGEGFKVVLVPKKAAD